MVGGLECGAPRVEINVAPKALQDVSRGRKLAKLLGPAGLGIDKNMAVPVGGDCEAQAKATRVAFRLLNARCGRGAFCFGLKNGKRHAAKAEQIVGVPE